jgi:hypothetical protein
MVEWLKHPQKREYPHRNVKMPFTQAVKQRRVLCHYKNQKTRKSPKSKARNQLIQQEPKPFEVKYFSSHTANTKMLITIREG